MASTAIEVLGYSVLLVVGFVQSFEDTETRRVHVLTTQLGGVWLLSALGLASALRGEPSAMLRMVLCSLALWGVFVALDAATRGGIGRGDVRLAPTIGAAIGYLSIESFSTGILAIAVGGSALALVSMARHGAAIRIPFVPVMYLAVLVSVIVHG